MPVLLVEQELLKLGLAANVADNVKVLGGNPLLVGVVGKDRGAQDFKHILNGAGISSAHLITDSKRRTILKERIVTETQQLLRVDYETQIPCAGKTTKAVHAKILSLIPKVDAVILEDYAKGLVSLELAKSVFAAAKKYKKLVSVDPNSKTGVEFYRGAGVLTPNTREAEKLSGISIKDEDSLKKAGKKILASTQAQHLVITRGKDGMALFSKGNSAVQNIPTFAREVYDVSGAGDTVIAVLTLALAAGASLEDAAVLGNIAAGIEVGKRGTATVSPDEIRVELER